MRQTTCRSRWPAVVSVLLPLLSAATFASAQSASDATYDARDYNLVTPVKDQGQLGVCWAFSGMAAIESGLLKQGVLGNPSSSAADLSEWHVANWRDDGPGSYTWIDDTQGYGSAWAGGRTDVISYTAAGLGPVFENQTARTAYPLSATNNKQDLSGYVPAQSQPLAYAIRDAYRLDGLTNTQIKQAVLDYGAVQSSMFVDASYSFMQAPDSDWTYFQGTESDTNHGVTIVGWDDAQVVPGAPDNGAWLIKNSWGTSYSKHNSGYFYLSYHDAAGGKTNAAYVPAANTGYGDVYQHQTGYPLGTSGYTSSSANDWAAARFTTAAADTLTAVAFWTAIDNEQVTIEVFDSWTDATNHENQLLSDSASIGTAGYHLIDLSSELSFGASDEFVVAVGFSQSAEIQFVTQDGGTAGNTYYAWQMGGSWGSWTDFDTGDRTFALKAVMVPEPCTMLLLGIGTVGLIRRRRQRGS